MIAGIFDAAVPIEAPAPGIAASMKKSARRKARPVDADAAASAGAAAQTPDLSDDPEFGPSSSAAPPAVAENVVNFHASSQKGALAKKPALAAASGGGGASRRPPDDDFDTYDLDRRLAFYPHTDLGNAERFRDRWRHKLIYCPALGWLWWDGKRWSRAGADEKVKSAEHETVRAIQREAQVIRGTDLDARLGEKKIHGVAQAWMTSDAIAAWGRQSEQANRLAPIAKRAAPYLAVASESLDADPFKFNVANGTLVFSKSRDGDYVSFQAHDPADLITKCSPAVYDPDAVAPVFDAFLEFVQPSVDDRRFLLQWQGMSLTGDITAQKLAVFWGKGRNGKSTFTDAIAFVIGDYSETVPIETFLNEGRGRNAGQATPDLAILPGVRHLRTSEPDKGAKLAEALIKLATGGEPIQARHLNRDYFKFYPQFKLTISGNYRPQIAGADEGIWRRVQLIPWAVTVPADKVDPELGDKLRGEASGILNRLLDGLRDWLDHGLVTPESVKQATADYRSDSDPLGRFLTECVIASAGDRVQSSVMYEVFLAWAQANGASGRRDWSNRGMTAALKERGFVAKQSNVMWWLDVKLVKSVNDFVDNDGKPLRIVDADSAGGVADDDRIPF